MARGGFVEVCGCWGPQVSISYNYCTCSSRVDIFLKSDSDDDNIKNALTFLRKNKMAERFLSSNVSPLRSVPKLATFCYFLSFLAGER